MIEAVRWCLSAASLLWMICVAGLGVVALAERLVGKLRGWYVVWIAGVASAAPILYITGRIVRFSGPAAMIACTAVGLAMLAVSRLTSPRPLAARRPKLHIWALVCVVLVTLTLATAYLEIRTDSDIYPTVVRDWNPRQAMIWSIRRFDLPLQDSLFYPGRSLPMYYSLGLYPAVAAASEIGGPSVPDSWPYAIMTTVTFLALCLLAGDLAGRAFGSRAAASWTAVLICVGGMDVLVNLGLKVAGHPVSLGHVGAWANPRQLRIDGLYVCALWAVPHLASAASALLLLRWMPLDIRRRPGACVAAGVIIAGMFYLSPYVTAAAAAALAGSLALRAFRRRWRRWARHLLSLACCGVLAGMLALIWMVDLNDADLSGGQRKLLLAAPAASIHPVSWLVPGPVGGWCDLAVQLLLELSPVAALGLLGWHFCKPKLRWRLQVHVLAVSMPVVVLLFLFVRSTGLINDWAVRVAHVLQISAAVLGGGLMARAGSWPRTKRLTAYAMILLGFSATAWQMGSANLGRFLTTTPPDRWQLYQAARHIDLNTPAGAVVMYDLRIDGVNYARRWTNRRALLVNLGHGSMSYTDQRAKAKVLAACNAVSEQGLGTGEIDMLRLFGATVALVPVELPAEGLRPGRILYRNEVFAVVDLTDLPAH